jgi:hypothetical protein
MECAQTFMPAMTVFGQLCYEQGNSESPTNLMVESNRQGLRNLRQAHPAGAKRRRSPRTAPLAPELGEPKINQGSVLCTEACAKVPSAKRILTAFMPLRRGPAVTQTTNFRANLAPLQVWVLGSVRHGHPTLSPKISVARSQVIDHGGVHHNKLLGLHEEGHLRGNSRPLGFPTPQEAWISSPWLPHLETAFRRFQAEAPKSATELPLEATELGAKSGNSLWCMPPYSESGRILLAEGTFESRLRRARSPVSSSAVSEAQDQA